MNFERAFALILRLYPAAFRERFGAELQLGFEDAMKLNPSSLEMAKWLLDVFVAAIFERLHATWWVYWLCVSVTSTVFGLSLAAVLNPGSAEGIYKLIQPYMLIFSFCFLIAVLLRLERIPSRLEWIGLALMCSPLLTYWISVKSPQAAFWFNFPPDIGLLIFAAAEQRGHGMSFQVRLMKLSLGLMGVVTLVNLLLYFSGVVRFPDSQSAFFQYIGVASIALSVTGFVIALIWKPRAVALPSS